MFEGTNYGEITFERLKRSYKFDAATGEYDYSEGLRNTYLRQQMLKMYRGEQINAAEIGQALALFGIRLTSPNNAYGEKCATINHDECAIFWYVFEKEHGAPVDKLRTTICPAGEFIKCEKIKKRHRRAFSDLSPELKEKLKKRYGWK